MRRSSISILLILPIAAHAAFTTPSYHNGYRKIIQPHASPTDNEIDLSSFFKSPFNTTAKTLSPHRIVEMMNTPTTTTTSTVASSMTFENKKPLRQELFSSPLISVLYERILPPLWQAGLRIGGPDEEYNAAMEFLGNNNNEPTPKKKKKGESQQAGGGGVILDLSCGTGFVASRLATSGIYNHVFALDYSRQMLNELVSFVQQRRQQSKSNDSSSSSSNDNSNNLPLSIIRGDAMSLPFQANSLDAIYWGAAMHCVPSAEVAMRDVYRTLKPGGKLYATTFLRPFPDVVFRFFTVEEMRVLATTAGFDPGNVDVEGRGVYGILRAVK